MSIGLLPPELLLMVVSDLESAKDINAFSQSSRQFYPVASDLLYRNNIKQDQCSALFWAAKKGSAGTIERVLSYGVDVDTRDEYEVTSLIYAAKYGNLGVASVLLQNGADHYKQTSEPFPETCNAYGPAIFEAAREGRNEMVKLLLDNGSDINHNRVGELVVSNLEAAISGGHSSTVQLLLDHGAGIETPGWYETPLIAAAYYGFPDVALLLLKNGADIEVKAEFWGTALQTAAETGNKEVVQLLLDWGVDVNAFAGIWGMALVSAMEGQAPDIIELLIEQVLTQRN
ncbi:ankyrin repeat-containing domain protein [Aspergillus spinulosporus]